MAKKIYIIPGFGETTRAKNYKEIIHFAKSKGFKIVPIKIIWSLDLPFSNFIKQVNKQIPNKIPGDYIFGFSFGAYITALLASKKKAKGYFFCSMSPYFKEDLKFIPDDTKNYFGKVFMSSFKRYSFPKNVKGSAWFFIGNKDWQIAINRLETSYKQWKGPKEIHILKNVGHKLNTINYTKKIKQIIKSLE